jgi:phosphoglycolate phosphatase
MSERTVRPETGEPGAGHAAAGSAGEGTGAPRAPEPRIQVVMFDFDGVIADTRDRFCAAASAAFVEIGRRDLADRATILALLDDNWFKSLRRAGLTEEQHRRIDEVFGAQLYEEAPVFPGTREMLARLAVHTLVIITSSRTASVEDFVASRRLPGISEVIGSDVETSKVRKIARVMAMHGPSPHYWYIGDTAGDIVEGRQVGATTIGVAWGYHGAERLRLVTPDFIAETPDQLADIVQGERVP